jgi:hypothetical protein
MKVDKLMLEVDHAVRHAYEERVASSEPSGEDGESEAADATREAA